MKALTIRQPWASLIAAGVKSIETRSWRTHHRGPVAIHAGLHRPVEGEDVGDWWWGWDVDHGVIVRQEGSWAEHPAPLGAVVAVADLVECVPTLWLIDEGEQPESISCQIPYGDFTPGRYAWAWLLANVRPLDEPIPCPGAQGLWTLPDDVEAAVRAQLREVVAS
jgi:hypothetical protein